MVEALATELQRYVPAWVAARAASAGTGREERFDAALMIADVSGFTALGQRLATGPEGAETLWRIVNAFFSQTLDLIHAHGGDVLRFAGDAPIVVWPVRDGEDLSTTVRRAAACGLALQARLGEYDTGEGAVVRFRVGIGSGQVLAARLGDVQGRAEPLIGGAPFDQVARALEAAGIGQVVVSQAAAALLAGSRLKPTAGGCCELLGVVGAPEPVPTGFPRLDAAAYASLRRFVPRGVLERLEAGHAGWLGELRTVSTMFVAIDGLDYGAPGVGERLRALVPALQDAVYRMGGSVNQFLVDDKGTVLLAAWGLPGTTHVDDPARAVRSGRAVLRALAQQGLGGSVGISTGRVFCGVKGNRDRAEYGLLGAPVNLAARLMQRAGGGVLCDQDTERAARGAFAFEALPPVKLKGHGEGVPVFQPVDALGVGGDARPMVGREAELAAIQVRLDALADGTGGVILVEGEPGLGKSALVREVVARARGLGLRTVSGAADAIEHRTPYFALRAVFAALLELDPASEGEARAQAAQRWFDAHPSVGVLGPLLNPLLGVSLPDSELTAPMEGEARAEKTRAACLDVLALAGPVLVVVDDLHWLDSASWELLRFAMRELPGVLFLFTTRPAGDDPVVALLLRSPGLVHLPLGPLPPADVVRLVQLRLGVDRVPEAVQSMILERAEGHPFFSEELLLALLDEGVITVERGICALREDVSDLSEISLPRTLDGLIAARLDALSPVELLSLKTASVIGRVFRRDMLCGLYPVDEQRLVVPAALDGVRARDLTQVELPEPELTYLFKHGITQQVAYDQLLFEQRRTLHAAAARWYEDGKAGSVEPHYPVIAYHWRRAEDRDRAIDALEAAGEQAFASFAHREALGFFEGAEELDAGRAERASDARRAGWARRLGEACSHLGRPAEGLAHLVRAVGLLGQPIPGNVVLLGFGLLFEALRQIWRRWVGPPAIDDTDRDRKLAAVSTFAELSLLAYYQSDVPLTLYTSLRALNLAETCSPSPQLALMKAAFAHVANGTQLHGAAERYSLEAVRTVEQFPVGQATARVHQYRGALLGAYGRWSEIQPHADAAMAASLAIGYGRGEEEAINLEIYVLMATGRYDAVNARAEQMERSARWREDDQVVFWAQVHRAEAAWMRGDQDAASSLLDAMDPASQTDATVVLRAWGLRVHVLVARGELDAARTVAEAHLLPQRRPSSFIELRGYTAVPELFLALAARGDPGAASGLSRGCRTLRTFAAIFPQGRSVSLRMDGLRLLAEGRPARGRDHLERALAAAREAGEVFEVARAEQALAGHPGQ